MDLLMWIGYGSYATVPEFIDEARRIGVSKRVMRVPDAIVLGETRLYLAHEQGVRGKAPRSPLGVIFGYCVIDAVEVVTKDRRIRVPECVTILDPLDVIEDPERGHHFRNGSGVYLRSSTLVRLDPPRDPSRLCVGQFRSYKWVDRAVVDTLPGRAIRGGVVSPTILGSAWTSTERETLAAMIVKMGPMAAVKEFQRLTGRPVESSLWQYKQGRLPGLRKNPS